MSPPPHPLAAVLQHYGATWIPGPTVLGSHYVSLRCPFHEDHSASAQTDGVQFRCFTCDLYYPSPVRMIADREGLSGRDAHDRYHELAGPGYDAVRGTEPLSFRVSGGPGNHSRHHRSRSPRRVRQAGARTRSDGGTTDDPVPD